MHVVEHRVAVARRSSRRYRFALHCGGEDQRVVATRCPRREVLIFRRKAEWPKVEHDEIVRRTRILVIDDGEFPYGRLFKRDGYNLEKWSTLKDMGALERGDYDVVLLDLHGVGKAESSDQGLGVLRHIRETNPAQIVVAYSNAE
jgi:hypothetical protein